KDYDAQNFEMLRGMIAKEGADIAGIYAIAANYAMKDHGFAAAETRAAVTDIDAQVATVVDAVTAAGRYDDTVFVVMGDHGDTDTPKAVASKGEGSVVAFLAEKGIKAAKITADDVMLAWLADSSQALQAVSLLDTPEAKERFGIDRVLGPEALKAMGDFADDQMPDFALLGKPGGVYPKLPSTKMGEHGRAFDSRPRVDFVMAGPGIKSGAVVDAKVNVFSTAPTLAKLLGLSLPTATSPVLAEALR